MSEMNDMDDTGGDVFQKRARWKLWAIGPFEIQARYNTLVMIKFFPLIILFFAVSAFAQASDPAVPTYSINEKLIGLSNLSGLSDCPVQTVVGKVRKIERGAEGVRVTVKVDKKTRAHALIPLERVSDDERKTLFRHLITKNNTIRISGYACTEEAPLSAFSVDRVY